MVKHTKETCFKLVGFPKWWEDGHKPGRPRNFRATIVVVSPEIASSGDVRREEGSRDRSDDWHGFAAVGLKNPEEAAGGLSKLERLTQVYG